MSIGSVSSSGAQSIYSLKKPDAAGTDVASPKSAGDQKDKQNLDALKATDRQVRAHEAAHQAAAGGLAGAASFNFVRGSDGTYYAIGGEVSIDTSPVSNDPQATLRKAEIIRRAALAPAEPSSQDQQVAAAASQMEAQANLELAKSKKQLTAYADPNEALNLISVNA